MKVQCRVCPMVGPMMGPKERLVGITENTLKRAIGHSHLYLEDITRVHSEVEANINSQPLTYLGNDPEDSSPLTPSHSCLANAQHACRNISAWLYLSRRALICDVEHAIDKC
ncbi:hypothetical protein HPB51_005990 [Rhipicephalus microplus]|uniref:Uncharacterized protein n=1 Tax=Rhipicephalus microplus TaxID=6941 RepID=A0A9J6DLN2_RHIMP|nr:hypothetical protein HPB51_005990 [Rhipicephalus microplus]